MNNNRQINVSLTLFDILFSLSLIIINDLTLNLSPDYFTLFNVMSLIISLVCEPTDRFFLEVATSLLNIGIVGYFFSIVVLNTVQE